MKTIKNLDKDFYIQKEKDFNLESPKSVKKTK